MSSFLSPAKAAWSLWGKVESLTRSVSGQWIGKGRQQQAGV
ncbi:MAG: hypothetical protein WCS16_00800 [Desulfuromonas sp.]